MTPQPSETTIATSVAPMTAKPVIPFNPLVKSGTLAKTPTPANDTTEHKRTNILSKRRRRRARLAARY